MFSENGGSFSACGWRGVADLRCYEEFNSCFDDQQDPGALVTENAIGEVLSMKCDLGNIKNCTVCLSSHQSISSASRTLLIEIVPGLNRTPFL